MSKIDNNEPFDTPTDSLPSYVYVVATGGFRIAIESELPITIEDVCAMAIERFISMGGPGLGIIMEITECSNRADPSSPTYVHTETQLRRVGKWAKD